MTDDELNNLAVKASEKVNARYANLKSYTPKDSRHQVTRNK